MSSFKHVVPLMERPRFPAPCVLLTTTSYQDTPGKHHDIPQASGWIELTVARATCLTLIHISRVYSFALVEGGGVDDMEVLCGQGLALRHFGSAQLGDAPRVKRLVETADHILRHP